MSALRRRRLSAISGGGGGLPNPPVGYAYVIDALGNYVVDISGNYVVAAV